METRPYRSSMPIEKAFEIIGENISKYLSIEMFEVIKQHQDEINTLVLQSQIFANKQYFLGLDK